MNGSTNKPLLAVNNGILHVNLTREVLQIIIKSILFLKAEDNEVLIRTGMKEFKITSNLDELLAMLPTGSFIRVHPDFVINLEKVASYHGSCFYMVREGDSPNRHVIEIGETYLETMLEKWNSYLSQRVIPFKFAPPHL